ncbi:MAG: S8 family serine peptidase [Acidobacteriota bacterium]
MTRSASFARRSAALAVALAHLAVVPGLAGTGPADSKTGVSRPKLFKDSRQSLAIVRAQGRQSVMVLLVSRPGMAAAVARGAAAMGGDVRYRNDAVGYLRVRIAPDLATKLSEMDAVEAATIDMDDSLPSRLGPGRNALPGPDPAGSAPPPAPARPAWPPQLGEYPLEHPYSPIHDLAADGFRSAHPTWDGRGATIALLDGNFDVLLPEFQTAYTLAGKAVPKVADYLNVTDPRDDADLNPQWVDMKASVRSAHRKLDFGGKTFRVSADGAYRIGFFDERKFNQDSNAAYMEQDIDRNGNPRGDDGKFGVLWNEATGDVWVDTNRNLDFTDEKALTDYAKRPEFGVFGKDDPATPYRETVAFAVQTDKRNKFVSINVAIYQHATTILGSVVGNKEPHGRIQGVAPGARVVSMFYGVSNEHGLIEGLIAAFEHPQVDLIVLEQSVAIASISYLLADATHPMSLVAQRLTERYKKLMFVPGDNAPAFGFVAEDGLARGVVSVGGYQSAESYRVNNGFVPEHEDNLHWGALSHGPAGNGALKPDLLAPSGQMGTEVGYRKGAGQKGLYQLPPGYSVDGGTSTATPMAAGAAALVVSAAKQSGVSYDADRLKAALTGSARFIANLQAHEQGNGLIQVGPAFELLRKLQASPRVEIVSRAPVKTKLAALLATPGEGVGLYEREGWTAGRKEERTVTLTRTSGAPGSMSFSLSWQGNDGTFSSPATVDLPLQSPVALPIQVSAGKEGAHSAVLTIDHPSVPGHVHRVLATIVVPHRFTAANGYRIETEITPPVPGDAPVFVDIPPGTNAVTIGASSPAVSLSMIGPDKDALYPCAFELEPQSPPQCSVAMPQPGVWEINVATSGIARRFDPQAINPLKATPVTVTASVLALDLTAPSSLRAASVGTSQPFSLELVNRLAKVSAAATSVALGSMSKKRATIAQGEQQVYEIQVPKGAASLMARVSGVADSVADLDIYLLDCTAPQKTDAEKAAEKDESKEKDKGNRSPMRPPAPCGPAAKAADVGSGGMVAVANPKEGRWVVVVDAYASPHGATDYDYVDFFSHPGFGAISFADLPEERGPSKSWKAPSNAWTARLPEAPRRLGAFAIATSPDVTAAGGRFGQGEKQPVPLGTTEVVFGDPSSAGGGDR